MIVGYGNWYGDGLSLIDDRPGRGLHLGNDTSDTPWPGRLVLIGAPDPRVLVADELLWTAVHRRADLHPDIRLEWHGRPVTSCPANCCAHRRWIGRAVLDHDPVPNNCYRGSLLRITTTTVTLVYRIDEYEPVRNAWWAQWPD